MSAISGRRPGIGLWRMVEALVRQRRRLALATIAIALAVGYLAGALTLLDRVSKGLDQLAAAGAERADLVVEGEVAYESALEQTRRLVPAGLAPSLLLIPGVEAVTPRLEEVAIILGPDGEPVVAPGLSEQPIGSNWPEDDAMSPYRFVGEGRAPTGSDEVVIDQRSAETAGASVGDEIVVVGKGEPRKYEIVGIVAIEQGRLPAGSSLALFSTDEARSLFQMPDSDNRVAIRLEPGADPEQVAEAVRTVLPGGAEVVDGATGARHRQESITRSFALIRLLITAFALLALVVGMVTVANSLTLLYAERRRTFAALRLVGAHERQLLAVALVEAAMLAGVASLLGAPLGLVLGRIIEGALGALGTSIPVAGSLISLPAIIGAVVIGTVATVVAAVVPALKACRVAPIEAVADSPSEPHLPWQTRILNKLLVGVGGVALIFGLLLLGDISALNALGVAVGVVVVMGVLGLLPTALSLGVAAGIRIIPTRPETLSRIGARDAVRNRSRTAATTGALLLATAVVAGLAVFLSSFTASVDGDVDRLVRADLVVDSGTFTKGGLPGDLIDELRELPEVSAVSGWQPGRLLDPRVRITGLDGDDLDQLLDPGWVEGSTGNVGPQGIALDQATAEELGVGVGDLLNVTFTSGGVESLTVDGIYTQGSLLLGEAFLDRETILAQVPATPDIAALVTLAEDTPANVDAVEELAANFGVEAVLRPGEFVERRSELLDGFQRVIQWMLLFTLLQALVGVVNTLLLSVGERRREFGLLRATGASRAQLTQLVLIEGISFAVIGTVLGLLVGVCGAVLGVRALGSYGITSLSFPPLVLFATALAAMALGVGAAVVPARWAASVPPLEAVADAGGDGRSVRRGRPKLRPERRPAVPEQRAAPSGQRPEPQFAHLPPPPVGMTGSPTPPTAVPVAPVAQTIPPEPPAPTELPPPYTAPPTVPPTVPPTAPGRSTPFSSRPSSAKAESGRPDSGVADASKGWVRRGGPQQDRQIPEASTVFRPKPPDATSGGHRRAAVVDEASRLRLGSSLDRLEPATVRIAGGVLVPLARELAVDERLEFVAQGWSKGLMCLVAQTDVRLVVVVDRFPEPLVETLSRASTTVTVFGPPGADRVSLAVVDGNRLLEVTGVRDLAEAAGLAGEASPAVPEFF